MTRDELIDRARNAGFVIDEGSRKYQPTCIHHTSYMVDKLLMRFAAVFEAERDALRAETERLTTDRTALIYSLNKAESKVLSMRAALHEIAEEWAGAECGEPITAQEAYAVELARRMGWMAAEARDAAMKETKV